MRRGGIMATCAFGTSDCAALQRLAADEPIRSLDRQTANAVGDLVLDIQQQENAILLLAPHSQALAKM